MCLAHISYCQCGPAGLRDLGSQEVHVVAGTQRNKWKPLCGSRGRRSTYQFFAASYWRQPHLRFSEKKNALFTRELLICALATAPFFQAAVYSCPYAASPKTSERSVLAAERRTAKKYPLNSSDTLFGAVFPHMSKFLIQTEHLDSFLHILSLLRSESREAHV